MAHSAKSPDYIEHVVHLYGDLIFDLCDSVLWSSTAAHQAFRTIFKDIRKHRPSDPYLDNERAWVLHLACRNLKRLNRKIGRHLTASEQVMLDAIQEVPSRLGQFDSYFHRLILDDQLVLILRDKYGLPYSEMASALGVPEGSLKVRRQQALRTLEEWLWQSA